MRETYLFKKVIIAGTSADDEARFQAELNTWDLAGEVLANLLNPNSPEGIFARKAFFSSPEDAKKIVIGYLESRTKDLQDERKAQAIVLGNTGAVGFDNDDFNALKKHFLDQYGISNVDFYKIIIQVHEKTQTKNISSQDLINILQRLFDRFGNNPDQVIKTAIEIVNLPSDFYGSASMSVNLAIDYIDALKTNDKNEITKAKSDLQKFLLSLDFSRVIVEGKQMTAQQFIPSFTIALDDIAKRDDDFTNEEAKIYMINRARGQAMQASYNWYMMLGDIYLNFAKSAFDQFTNYINNGKFNWDIVDQLIQQLRIKFIQSQSEEMVGPIPIPFKKSENSTFKSMKRFAAPPALPASRPTGTTPTSDPTELQQYMSDVNQAVSTFESIKNDLLGYIKDKIDYALNKSLSSQKIGEEDKFYAYTLDLEDSKALLQETKNLISDTRNKCLETKNIYLKTVDVDPPSGLAPNLAIQAKKIQELAKLKIENSFYLFERDLEGKIKLIESAEVILPYDKDIVELKQQYDIGKMELKTQPLSARARLPEVLFLGFSLAKIYDKISKEFQNKANSTSLFGPLKEIMHKNSNLYLIKARKERLAIFEDLLAPLSKILGVSNIKDTMQNLGAVSANDSNVNIRYSELKKENNNKVKNYYNDLFMQSLDPVPMGDILVEKPKHGDKSIDEEIELHKDTMKKYPRFKKNKRFKK